MEVEDSDGNIESLQPVPEFCNNRYTLMSEKEKQNKTKNLCLFPVSLDFPLNVVGPVLNRYNILYIN